MKKLLLILPIVAGCTTTSVTPTDTVLRDEISILRKEVNDLKSREALRRFNRGERIHKPVDKRNDLPKGVAR